MTPNPERSGKKLTRKRLTILLGILGALLAMIIVGVSILRGSVQQPTGLSPQPFPSATPPSPTPTAPVSPLIFGTNMSLFASVTTDQMLDSPATQKALQQIHVRII